MTVDGVTMISTAAYSTDGNRLVSTTDALGKVTTYQYNENTNVLEWVKYPEDTDATRTNYTYDNMYRSVGATSATDTGLNLAVSYTYTDDLLTQVQSGSTAYSFSYGAFALRSRIQIGSRVLASYSYTDDRNNRLEKLDYGNQDSIQYTYDNLGRVVKETFEDGDTVTYRYDNTGALATVTDSATGIVTTYYYDFTDRLMRYTESSTGCSHSVGYSYDNINNLTALVETINGVSHTTEYAYDEDNRITRVTNGDSKRYYIRDDFGRVIEKRTGHLNNSYLIVNHFLFDGTSDGKTSGRINNVRIGAGGYSADITYYYDDNGNIVRMWDYFTDLDITYAYDSANQLIRENNPVSGLTTTWTYDNAGNILSRKTYAYTTGSLEGITPTDTVLYTYGDTDWGDLLTAYDGTAITYDGIGNPLTDGTWSYTWEHGRELASMTSGTVTWTYTYNADGIRTSRSNGTKTYNYIYNGGSLSQMTVGNDTLYFSYDAEGIPMAVVYNGVYYYYVTSLQGDVVAIVDSAGHLVVQYAYDAWGNPIGSISGTMAATLGTLNPLRYRGYVYDHETNLYYLQSRYYNPEMGRFINVDVFVSVGQGILGHNMFAYCINNPIFFIDNTGYLLQPNTVYICDGGSGFVQGNRSATRNVTDEINAALEKTVAKAKQHRQIVDYVFPARNIITDLPLYYEFYNMVNHKEEWDIKWPDLWIETIGTDAPADGEQVIYNGSLMTRESLGNYTYGVIGRAYDFDILILIAGSYYAAKFPTHGTALENEIEDWGYIIWGYINGR